MSTQNISSLQIEKYIRNLILQNDGIFDRYAILKQSKEWIEKYPIEFNSILIMIEKDSRNDDMIDDSTPSVAYGCGGYADDSTPSVAYGCGGYGDDSTPSVAYGCGGYADDYYGSQYMKEPISLVVFSPKTESMGSDHIDSSPCGHSDDDFDVVLQRTMSS
jgi:hypothetical protein